jgi:FixJ family two-component response regulator
LLLTDIVVPLQTGAELAARLTMSLPDIQVLYMSGYMHHAMSGVRSLPKNAMFIQKPFSAEDLRQAVRQGLQEREGRTERRAQLQIVQ